MRDSRAHYSRAHYSRAHYSPEPFHAIAIAIAIALSLVCTLVMGAGCRRSAAPPTPTGPLAASLRHLAAGAVVGTNGLHGGHVWKGIPYAKPPVGRLRWRAPQPLEAWSGTREALHFGALCPQFASPLGGDHTAPAGSVVGREDCLFLNVYAPAFEPGAVPTGEARLPVMFWIHGGGNTIGASSFYNGSRLASEQNVVVVSVNYRLGLFGWLRHPKLNAGRDAIERSGNFGTLDLIAGLRWVRAHIGAFGGDPANVTIFGESAGGQNVFTLLGSPLAAGLFERAIVESGGSWGASITEAEHLSDDPEPGDPRSSGELLLTLLQREGRAADRDGAKRVLAGMSADEVDTYLRSKGIAELLSVYKSWGTGMYAMPRVFRDGRVLPKEPIALLLAEPGRTNLVPTLLGTNHDEQKLFLFVDPRYVHRLFGVLPIVKDREAFLRDASLRSRSWKITGADFPAEQLVKRQPGRVFVYRFDWDEEPKVLWADLGELLGAAHGFEIPFVFGHFDLGPEAEQLWTKQNAPGRETLSAAMRAYWAEFARHGDPGRGGKAGLPRWKPWDPQGDRYLILDTEAGGGIRMTHEAQTIDALVSEVLADDSYDDERARCRALARLADDAPALLGAAAYHSAGGGRCARFEMKELLHEDDEI